MAFTIALAKFLPNARQPASSLAIPKWSVIKMYTMTAACIGGGKENGLSRTQVVRHRALIS